MNLEPELSAEEKRGSSLSPLQRRAMCKSFAYRADHGQGGVRLGQGRQSGSAQVGPGGAMEQRSESAIRGVRGRRAEASVIVFLLLLE